jgi:hypothetical protein
MSFPISDDKLVLFPMPRPPDLVYLMWSCAPPTHSEPVRAFSVDRRGPYCIPFKVRFRDGVWRHAATGDVLRVKIEGWR